MARKRQLWRVVRMVSVVIPLALGGLLSSASSFAQDHPGGDPQGSTSPPRAANVQAGAQGAEASVQLWSADEMRSAKPYDVITPAGAAADTRPEPLLAGLANAQPGADVGGLPTSAPGSRGLADALADVPFPAPVLAPTTALTVGADLQLVAGPYNYPPPYTRSEVFTGVAHPRTYALWPYTTIGKLFFRQYGSAYVCSAAAVGNRAIITAGHCIHAGNNRTDGWSTNVVFVPAYKDGFAPLGQWPAANWNLRVMTAWYTSGNPNGLRRDVGGAILNRNQYGQTLSQVTGWLGFAWNWSYYQHYNAFGYPQAAPFTGTRLIDCQGSYAYYSTSEGPAGAPMPRAIGCDMTGGSSGGPWILKLGTGNYLNGVNSFKRNGFGEEMFAPYFDTAIKNMKDCLVNEHC